MNPWRHWRWGIANFCLQFASDDDDPALKKQWQCLHSCTSFRIVYDIIACYMISDYHIVISRSIYYAILCYIIVIYRSMLASGIRLSVQGSGHGCDLKATLLSPMPLAKPAHRRCPVRLPGKRKIITEF